MKVHPSPWGLGDSHLDFGWLKDRKFCCVIVEHVENSTFKQLYRFGSSIYTSKPCYCKPTIAVRTYDHFISLVMQEPFATFQEPPAQQSSPPLWGTDMSQPFFWAQHDRQKVTWNGRMSKCAKTMDGWSRRFTFVLGVMVNFLNTSCLCLLLKDFNGSRDVQVQHSLLDRLNKRGSLQRRCWLPNPGCWCQESLLPVFEGPCQPVNLPNSLGWGVTHHHIPGVSSTNILLTSEPFCRKSWDWWHVLAIWGEHQLKLKKTFRQNHSQIGTDDRRFRAEVGDQF